MRKTTFLVIFAVIVSSVIFAATDHRDACRKIIYSAKPVDAIAALDDATLRTLGRYAMGMPAAGQEPLSAADAELFSFLATVEMTRRASSKDDFSLYLQEEHEKLLPKINGKGDVTIYVKEDGWLDLFKLNLMFAN